MLLLVFLFVRMFDRGTFPRQDWSAMRSGDQKYGFGSRYTYWGVRRMEHELNEFF